MIILTNVSKSYNNKPVLSGVSCTINDGDFLAITGVSGSGKTTLLNIMGCLEMPDEGAVSIDGQTNLKPKEKTMFYRHKAGFLFQNYALLEDKTVLDNLKIALTYRKVESPEEAIYSATQQLGLADDLVQKKVYQLSGGEQQRVALARITLKDPKYIFADEPTGNLDTDNRDIVFDHLVNLNKHGKTVIIVTHDKELVVQLSDVVALS
ncbi:MAG: ABC transporter ATP-binding protein [Oscillospiraceae bacterium]|nr:ABC transporter ATP-binding protein [Oscillospiraceae bacterium]